MTRQEQREQENALESAQHIVKASILCGLFMLFFMLIIFISITPDPESYGSQEPENALHIRHIKSMHAYHLKYKSSHP